MQIYNRVKLVSRILFHVQIKSYTKYLTKRNNAECKFPRCTRNILGLLKSLLPYAYGKQYVECRIQASKHDLDTDYERWMANTLLVSVLYHIYIRHPTLSIFHLLTWTACFALKSIFFFFLSTFSSGQIHVLRLSMLGNKMSRRK